MSSVVINGFTFCATHGSEICNKCGCCDYRKTNNTHIRHPKLLKLNEELDSRPSLADAFKEVTKRNESPPYQCKSHETANCMTCFDWDQKVLDRIKLFKPRNHIPVESSRDEKLGLLAAMGVKLPPATLLPEPIVDKRLRLALDASQYLEDVVKDLPVNPTTYPLWTTGSNTTSRYEATRRGNASEAIRFGLSKMLYGQSEQDLYESPFMDLRQTIMSLANGADNGITRSIIQDKDCDYAICIRVVEVRRIDEVPMFVVVCGRGTRTTPLKDTIGWVQETINASSGEPAVQRITATPQEQNLLLTLLTANAKHLSSDYNSTRCETERAFMLSFLLPVGPIPQRTLGRLANSSGCVLCGKETAKRCTGCLSVEYCSEECQKLHWAEHKSQCRSLKGAHWQTVKLSPDTNLMINLQDPLNRSLNVEDFQKQKARPVVNIHGNQAFLVKIQRSAARPQEQTPMSVYDRQRSISLLLHIQEDREAYEMAMEEMRHGNGVKIYRWAKHINDLELSICFNRAPPTVPVW
ncbi:hypothetical protein PM082_003110 [Marasmius tenuissimus]|nr:hypothetical protein PM082_003110 [Marasmius tenuissimus]